MTDRGLRLRLGLFVAGTLAGLAGLAVLFGGTPTLFTTTTPYVVTFPEAPGVAVGTSVRKSGVRIGQVTAVDLDDTGGLVRVTVALNPKYLPRTGEDAVISRGILSGDTSIDFVPKTAADGTPAPRGDPVDSATVIPGVAPANARTLLNQASTVLPSAQESLVRLSTSLQKFETAAPKIERTIDEIGGLAKSSREFIPEIRDTNTRIRNLLGTDEPAPDQVSIRALLKELIELLKSVRPVADDVRAFVKDNGPEAAKAIKAIRETAEGANEVLNPENRKAIAAVLKNLQAGTDDLTKTIRLVALLADEAEKTVKQFNARLGQTEKVLDNIDRLTKPFADNSPQLASGIDQTIKNLNTASDLLAKTLIEVQLTLKTVNRSDGTLQKVISDPMLYHNLNDTVSAAARVLARVDLIAKDLEVFADKVARKPETLGVGGAVRSSTGLKESPRAPLPNYPPAPVAPTGPAATFATPPGLTPIAPVPFLPGEPIPSFKPTMPNTDRPPLPGRADGER